MEATGRKRKGSHATPSTTEGNASKKLKLLVRDSVLCTSSPASRLREASTRHAIVVVAGAQSPQMWCEGEDGSERENEAREGRKRETYDTTAAESRRHRRCPPSNSAHTLCTASSTAPDVQICTDTFG